MAISRAYGSTLYEKELLSIEMLDLRFDKQYHFASRSLRIRLRNTQQYEVQMQTVPQVEPQTSVHDMSPFSFMQGNITGLSAYSSRALVCPGTAVVGAALPEDRTNVRANHAWLQSIGIGAKHLILVEDENLRQGILCGPPDKHYTQLVSEAIFKRNHPLSLFLPRDMEPLILALGLDWLSVLTPKPEIAQRFDDKHCLRMTASRLGMGNVFPAWEYISTSIDDLFRAFTRVTNVARETLPTDTIFLKVHNYDGGEGVLRWGPETSPKIISAFATKYLKQGLIVDAGYPRGKFRMHEYSVKVEISEQSWRICYFSRQLTEHDSHIGNEVAIGEDVLDVDSRDALYRAIAPLCNEAVKLGYGFGRPRTMGFDFMVVNSGNSHKVLILEANARTTAVDYAMAVCQQVAPRFGGKAAVIMENLNNLPADIGHELLRNKWLNGHPWDGRSVPGFLIGNPTCITRGKATIFCIGPNITEARMVRSNLLLKPKNQPIIRTFGRNNTQRTSSSES